MSESIENQFTSISKYVFSLPDLEDSSSIKVTDLVTIRCSSGRCLQPLLSNHRDPSGSRDTDGAVYCKPETNSPGVPGEISEDNLATKLSLPLPMTTTDCCGDDDRLLPLATAALPEMAESDGDVAKEQDLDSSSEHSIIPWLCDLEAGEDQRLIDTDGDSEVEMDRCDVNRCADIRPTKRHANLTLSTAGVEDLTRLGSHKQEPRRYTGSDRKHGDQREGTGDDFTDRRIDEYHRSTTKNRNKSDHDAGTGSEYKKNSASSEDCPSVRICKTTPAFLRINPRNFHGSDERDDPQTGGGRALLSRTLDQVRRRLMDDLSPVLSSDYEEGDEDYVAKEIESAKLRSTYLKNLLVLGVGFMLVFTSFCALRSLQSSINHDRGLGLAALSCMNASFAVGCIFATSVVQRVRPKRAIMMSLVGHLVYTVANAHATFYTLIPATVVIGFSMATLFVAQGTYLTSIAVTYAAVSGKKHDHIISLFNGFFLFMLEVAQIFGNLISSTVFSFYAEGGNSVFNSGGGDDDGGATEANTDSGVESSYASGSTARNATVCGSGYCHVFLIETMANTGLYGDTVVILVGVFLLVSVSGMIIIGLFLDKLDVIFHQSKRSLASQLCAIVRLHRDRRLTLCAPLMTFLGMQEAFVYGEFTKAFVTCPLGVHLIGYVMICFAGCASISSATIGCLQKYLPRTLIMTAGAVLHLVVMAYLYLWQPSAKDVLLIFVMSGLLGVADALWQTEICSLCGVLFDRRHREASFSCLRMYQSLGLSLALGYAQFLCVDVKIAILAGAMVSALVAYFGMEFSSKTRHGEQDSREPASV